MSRNIRIIAVALLVSVLCSVSFVSSGASATASDPKMFISGDNTFYVYAKSGETVSASFIKSSQIEPLGLPATDVTTTIEGPGIDMQKCIIPKDVAVGQGCDFNSIPAPVSGIWRVTFSIPEAGQLYPQVSPTTRWNRNMFSWRVAASDGKTDKDGRVWSELYAIRQPIDPEYVTDMRYYYVSEGGYIYKATYKGYNGQISTLSADAFGIRRGATCLSAYQSIAVDDAKMSPAFGMCGGSYKLFFEQPAGDLPREATTWSKQKEWVVPDISRPVVSDLTFTPDTQGDAQSGAIRFVLKNYVGQFTIKVDTNNDGNFDASEDVAILHQINKLGSGRQEVRFKGVNGDGRPIARSQTIGIKIDIAKIAEIHLVNADVEGRAGGLEITRMNGDNAPSSRMCWDDRSMTVSTLLTTEKADGRLCPESAGGVHRWPYGTGSWGDMHYIDDWAYATARVDGGASIIFPEDERVATVTRRGMSQELMVVSGVAATVVVGAVVVGIIALRRRRKTVALSAARAVQIPPSDTPPGRRK